MGQAAQVYAAIRPVKSFPMKYISPFVAVDTQELAAPPKKKGEKSGEKMHCVSLVYSFFTWLMLVFGVKILKCPLIVVFLIKRDYLMDSNFEQTVGLSIDDIDANRLLFDEEGEAFGLINNESVGNELLLDEERGNPNDDALLSMVNEEDCSGNTSEDDGESHVYKEPFLNQEFESVEAAYEFYNIYGLATGFGIRKSKTEKSKANHEVIMRRFVCAREGLKNTKDKRQVGKEVKLHRSTNASSQNNFVKNVVAKNLIDTLSGHGVQSSKIARFLTSASKVSAVTAHQVVSHVRVCRQNNMGREASLVVQQFHQRRAEDPNIYFAMEIDKKGNLRSMFWADSRARNAYLAFSDVIVFDVTYRTNRFQMPFAPFTGVNHHRQSTLFGCALLADEREETFTWLFEQWLKCMFGKAPGCIITDMDIAMRNAIRTIFPNTRHRFCSWHIQRHLVEHIAHMRDSDSEFNKDYNRWYFKKNIHKCEEEWGKFEQKYGIEENSWLCNMWQLRSHWMPAYFRDTFTAGMSSSSRSESINSFFDGFVNHSTTLQEFVEQYDKALEDRRKKEAEEDFRTKSSNAILLSSRNKLEAQAGKCYTRSMFTLFQIEMKDSNDCWFDLLGENDKVTECSVGLSDEET
ncbi:protein FAR1-RELATED SEQUENCE 5-like [Tasmannia lanceolata]|uniref:protein FAR1-RELATED SEQUENCE 5-like n=1 Tax=Tasmannia lanceolata TaxID=3420 RepID=UPI0040641E52